MKTLTIHVPDFVETDGQEITLILAARLYELGKLSLGQASAMAGLPKRAFAEILGSYGVSLINIPAAELANDVFNA
jgi:predicted HTH domain antitoxin